MRLQDTGKRLILILLIFLFILTSCGQENPPVNVLPPVNDDTGDEIFNEAEADGYGGNSKPLDYSPCEGIHVTADENAFYEDTTISFTPIDDDSPGIKELNEELAQEGFLMFSGFEVDAGLNDDEFIPGQYDVEYDLSTTDIDPKLYEYLSVYRIGDDGTRYELRSVLEGDKLKFSCNQNSLFVTGALVVALGCTIGYAAYDEYHERNKYYLDANMEVFTVEGSNPYLNYRVEWNVQDLELKDRINELKKRRIEEKYEEEVYAQLLDISGTGLRTMPDNMTIASLIKNKLDGDEEYQELKKKVDMPDLIKYTIQCIDVASEYLAEVEKLRMPLHTVPFKNVNDGESAFGSAVNRTLSTSYIEIRLGQINTRNKSDYYNFLLTITHELLHICQNRYRFPVDLISDSARYDEMIALVTEIKAKDYYRNNGIIPADADPQITNINHWGCMRFPIDGSGDSALDGDVRNGALINAGYCTGDFLQYLFDKTGKRPNANMLMYAREAHSKTPIVNPIRTVLSISENEFDIHFRNWLMSHRYDVGAQYYNLLYSSEKKSKYPLTQPEEVKMGEKYPIDFIHDASYFLNIRGFKYSQDKQIKAVIVPDKDLRDVFPSSNVVPGITYSSIRAGAYIDDFMIGSDGIRYLPVLEVEGDNSAVRADLNSGYTVYILDKTPGAELEIKDDKLQIVLPKPEPVAADGVADGYILKIVTGKGKTIEKEIPKEYFGKVLEMNKSELYDKDDTGEDLSIKATLNEFFLEGDNKIMGIVSDEAVWQSETEKCEIRLTLKKVTYTIAIENAIVYGEHPKGLIYVQAKPGADLSITVTSSDESGFQIGVDGDLVPSGKTWHWTVGSVENCPEIGYWFDIWGMEPGTKYNFPLAHLEIYAVNSYTEKPIWVYEPSWSETKKN